MLKNRHRDLAVFIKYIDTFYRRICKYERPKININDSTLSTELSKHAVDIFPGFLPLIAMKESPLFLLDCYRAESFRTLYMCISGISANRPADSCNFRISK